MYSRKRKNENTNINISYLTPSQSNHTEDGYTSSLYNSFLNVMSTVYSYSKPIFFGTILLGGGLISIAKFLQNDPPKITVYFEPIAGNLTPAKWVFLGEYHQLRSEVSKEVDKITVNTGKHVVQCEGVPNNIEVDCAKQGLTKMTNRICTGWEDPTDVADEILQMKAQTYGRTLRNIKQLYDDKNSEKEIDEGLKVALKTSKNIARKALHEAGLKNFDELPTNYTSKEYAAISAYSNYIYLQKIHSLRAQGKSYKDIINQDQEYLNFYTHEELERIEENDCNNIFYQQGRAEYKNKILIRNKAMVRSAALYPGFFTVSVSGKAHIEPTVLLSHCGDLDISDAAEYVKTELAKGKDQNPYAILAMHFGRKR